MRKSKNLYRFIGILIIIYILFKVDLGGVFSIVRQIDLTLFLGGLFFMVLFVFLKYIRWAYVLDKLEIGVGKKAAFKNYVLAFGAGTFTPFRAGELLKVDFLYKNDNSIKKSLFAVVADRVFDLLFVLFFASIALVLLSKNFLFLFFLLLAVFVSILLFKSKNMSGRVLNRLLPLKYKDSLAGSMINAKELINKLPKIGCFVFTVVAWLSFYASMFFLARSLDIPISFYNTILVFLLVNVASLLPITVSGIGTRDATLIFFFQSLGFSSAQALSLSLLVLFQWVIVFVACMAIYFFDVGLSKQKRHAE